jgi:hypothetical protein
MWSFRVERGRVGATLLSAASEVDLVVMGKAGRSVITGRRLGSVAREMLSGAAGPVLVVADGTRLQGPIVVVYDGSHHADKALVVAARLVDRQAGYLDILVITGRLEAIAELKGQAVSALATRGLLARCSSLTMPSVSRLVRVIESLGRGTVVLPAGDGFLDQDMVLSILERLENAVLVVGEPRVRGRAEWTF